MPFIFILTQLYFWSLRLNNNRYYLFKYFSFSFLWIFFSGTSVNFDQWTFVYDWLIAISKMRIMCLNVVTHILPQNRIPFCEVSLLTEQLNFLLYSGVERTVVIDGVVMHLLLVLQSFHQNPWLTEKPMIIQQSLTNRIILT